MEKHYMKQLIYSSQSTCVLIINYKRVLIMNLAKHTKINKASLRSSDPSAFLPTIPERVRKNIISLKIFPPLAPFFTTTAMFLFAVTIFIFTSFV